MTKIAFLGLGAMGTRMARRLLIGGAELRVWNRSPGPADSLVQAGAIAAATPRAAAEGADIVISMVSDDSAARAVWLDPETGAAGGVGVGALAVESSTVTPHWAGELAVAIAARGADFVEAPVAGSRPQAETGALIVMLGGASDAVQRARAALGPIGSAFPHIGPVGSAARLKLAVNSVLAAQLAMMAEVLAMLKGGGFDEKAIVETLASFPVMSPASTNYARMMAERQTAPMFTVDLMHKDLVYALGAGAAAGVEMPVVSAVRAVFEAAQAAGHGAENMSAVRALYK